MHRITEVELHVDLLAFSQWLNRQGVRHQITEEAGQQVIWLADPQYEQPVLEALRRYQNDPSLRAAVEDAAASPVAPNGRWQPSPKHAPLVFGLLILAALTTFFTDVGQNDLVASLLIVDPFQFDWSTFGERLESLTMTLTSGQFWRLFTPDLLHFSWPHLIFNGVMLWFLGSQVEWFDGRSRLVLLVVVTTLCSNVLQHLVTGPLFGGLSGVVYGILGYCWLAQSLRPRFQMPRALVTVAVVWMVIGFTSLPEWVGLGSMANEAHLGGFLSGLALAFLPVKR